MGKEIAPPRDERPLYTMCLRVRNYEIDALGHVNNAVYVSYLEQAAIEHGAVMGLDSARAAALGGHFVVRRHEIDYLGGAVAGDELEIETWPEDLRGPRAVRCYEIRHAGGKRLVAARTLWVWVDLNGRPRPIPREIADLFALPDDDAGRRTPA